MISEFGDVAIVPFPFVERTIAKMRPTVVLSNARFNDENGHTLLVMITTAKRSTWPSDIAIDDYESAGLSHPSQVRWKVFTLPNDLILRLAGKLGDEDRRKVRTAASRILS